MSLHPLLSTLLGALITYSAILFTNALDVRKRKRAVVKLIHALLQGLHDEISGLLEMASNNSVLSIEATPEGKPYEGLFSASQDYFTVYHSNAALVMQIEDGELRRCLIRIYTHAKGLLDKKADAEFREKASRILEMLAKKLAAPLHVASLNVRVTTKAGGVGRMKENYEYRQ